MRKNTGSTLAVCLIAGALLVVPPTAYTVAYFGLSIDTTKNLNGGKCRVYRSSWEADIFIPASLLESALTGKDVSPAWPGP